MNERTRMKTPKEIAWTTKVATMFTLRKCHRNAETRDMASKTLLNVFIAGAGSNLF